MLILEGRVEVTVGKENLVFEGGPFTHFGLQALAQNVGFDSPQQPASGVQNLTVMGSLQSLNIDLMLRHTYVPDYSVKALSEVVYLMVKRTLYLAAKRATLMEQSRRMGEHSNEPFDDEVEKVRQQFSLLNKSSTFHLSQLLHSLDEDDSTAHTNVNSPRMSKPASPTSQQNLTHPTTSSQHLHSVTFSGNHTASFDNSQKTSAEIHEGPETEVEQPLLNRSTNS